MTRKKNLMSCELTEKYSNFKKIEYKLNCLKDEDLWPDDVMTKKILRMNLQLVTIERLKKSRFMSFVLKCKCFCIFEML